MNAFAIFLENKGLFDRLFSVNQNKSLRERIIIFNFYNMGKIKRTQIPYNKKKYFFEHLYDAYSRFLNKKAFNKNFREDLSFKESDMIQDLTGMYCIETPLASIHDPLDLTSKIFDCLYKTDNAIFLSNEEAGDDLYQSFFEVISTYELNDEFYEKVISLSNDRSNIFYYDQNNQFILEENYLENNKANFFSTSKLSLDTSNKLLYHTYNNNNFTSQIKKKNVLFKIRLINQNSALNSDLAARILLEKNNLDLHKLLYPDEDDCCFTWLSIGFIHFI